MLITDDPWRWLQSKQMRLVVSLLIGCLGLLLGCAHARYVAGNGDAGQFILQRAAAYGGHASATTGLPLLGGDWRYIQDKFGVSLLFPLSRYAEVESFLTSAFGPRSNFAGWAARDIGIAIYLQSDGSNTLVGVIRPMHLFESPTKTAN
jgi:hypothetical protein